MSIQRPVSQGVFGMFVSRMLICPERRNLATFTAAIDSDAFNLFTSLNSAAITPPFSNQQFLEIFSPFENSVWLRCALTIVLCNVVLHIVTRPTVPTDASVTKRATMSARCVSGTKSFVDGIYDGSMAFLGSEDAVIDASTNWPARLVVVGLGIFVFIHVNSYTGSLAANYVSNNMVQLGNITSLQDIKSQGGKLCLYQSMAGATSPIISSVVPASQFILMDNYGPMLEQLVEGNCLGAVVGKFETITFIGASNVNFTVCTDPNDPFNYATCVNKSHPPAQFNLNPATCAPNCKYAERFCNLVQLQVEPTWSGLQVRPVLLPSCELRGARC